MPCYLPVAILCSDIKSYLKGSESRQPKLCAYMDVYVRAGGEAQGRHLTAHMAGTMTWRTLVVNVAVRCLRNVNELSVF